AFTAYLLLRAAEHDALAPFSVAMAWFVIPITLLTIGTGATRSILARR
ncbi:MAG: sodium:calcium antiporter, partial [Gemmatimonadetes bacterium]|nr:sodium:calcium antiporter [Gemmatimonadota bacterium]